MVILETRIHGTMTTSSKKDYLSILGLSYEFDDNELKKAFRREARKWHPDLNKNDINAEERFKLINEAYEFLRDIREESKSEDIQQPNNNTNNFSKGFPEFQDYLKTLFGFEYNSELNTNYVQYGVKTIKCSIPTLFIEVEYKTSDGNYLIEHEVYLYNEHSTLKDLEAYKDKVSYGFASQVTQEIKDIVEAFHNGYGCECLSSGDY